MSPARNRINVSGMKKRLIALAALSFVVLSLLAGCAATPTEEEALAPTFGCPRAGLMPDADRLAVFSDMKNPTRENVTVKAELYGITYTCKPVPHRGEIEVALTARFVADRQPVAGGLKGLTLPYFIAVLDENDTILMHRRFSVRLTFGEGAKNLAPTRARAQEQHTIPVAAPDAMAAGNYKIVAGFELIPAQVYYNKGQEILTPTP